MRYVYKSNVDLVDLHVLIHTVDRYSVDAALLAARSRVYNNVGETGYGCNSRSIIETAHGG